MDYVSLIKEPISHELADFIGLFNSSLTHDDGMLGCALEHVKQRAGKRMRPILILLMAKNFGAVSQVTLHSAVGLELLHTASLIHDDVVDEAKERRGQASTNALFDNRVAVLVGDYVLSTALLHIAYSGRERIVTNLAKLGQTLSNGEILQLSNIQNREVSEEFGHNLGVIFQIRDDIFDYYDDANIGKPTGNDMAEGKLTLPVIYALHKAGKAEHWKLVTKVKDGTVTKEEIARLVAFAKDNGGIEYSEGRMRFYHQLCLQFLDDYCHDEKIAAALRAYLDYVSERTK